MDDNKEFAYEGPIFLLAKEVYTKRYQPRLSGLMKTWEELSMEEQQALMDAASALLETVDKHLWRGEYSQSDILDYLTKPRPIPKTTSIHTTYRGTNRSSGPGMEMPRRFRAEPIDYDDLSESFLKESPTLQEWSNEEARLLSEEEAGRRRLWEQTPVTEYDPTDQIDTDRT